MKTITLEQVNQNINNLRLDVIELKVRLNEEFELSDEAKKELEQARKTMKNEFVSHEEIMARYG